MRVWAWLSGEHPELPAAEAAAVFAAEGIQGTSVRPVPRFLMLEAPRRRAEFEAAFSRLALTHEAGQVAYHGAYDAQAIAEALDAVLDADARVAVRATRLGDEAFMGVSEAERTIGAAVGRRIDLADPTIVVRVFLAGDSLWLGPRWSVRDPIELDRRHVRNRPFFSPVSLEPRLARALVNLAGVRAGDLVVDPFCGTGGILLEAAVMGCRVAGSDLDPDMVRGARANLAHFGHEDMVIVESDIVAAAQRFVAAGVGPADAVVADLPYGRSASTGREDRGLLYARAADAWPLLVRPGGRLVLGVPGATDVAIVARGLTVETVHELRVHRSLTRRFVVARDDRNAEI